MTDPSPLRQALETAATPDDFDVQRKDGRVSFVVRTGDGAPYRVYLSASKADDLSALLAGERRAQEEPSLCECGHTCSQHHSILVYSWCKACGCRQFHSPASPDAGAPASPPAPPVAGAQEPTERAALVAVINAYDSYRAIGVLPAPDRYQQLVAAIDRGRNVIAGLPASRPAAPAPNEQE